jgi:alpha-L-arabinofuranosidase
MGSAIFVANLMQVFARTPQVTLATYFKLYEDSFMGAIQHNGDFKPAYYALQMFGTNFGSDVVETTVASPAFSSPAVGLVAAVGAVPYLDVVASLSPEGSKLYVIAVNKSTTNPVEATLNLGNFTRETVFTERVLSAPVLDANNGPSLPEIQGLQWAQQSTLSVGSMFHSGAPGTVVTKTATRNFESNTLRFAPLSVTALEFTRAPHTRRTR